VEGLIGEFHLHQHVAGEEAALGLDLAAAAHFHDLFGRDQHLLEQVAEALLDRLAVYQEKTVAIKNKIRSIVKDPKTAEMLGMERSNLYRKMKALGLPPKEA